RRKFFLGKDLNANNIPDLSWFGPDGKEPRWTDPNLHTLCYQLDGSEESSEQGEYTLFIILNAGHNAQYIKLPILRGKMGWYRIIDTSLKSGEDFLESGKEILLDPPEYYISNPRSTVALLSK
ncbi:MAG: glycogen debranching enzyme GlgX, partial [Nitrospirae bacterium]|nr:glycogen debranching enzyme GlgX [Nitrospirota bacterium]